MKVSTFIKQPIAVEDATFKVFFKALFLTTLLSYINYIIPFLPGGIAGFNWSGVAWITMLLVTLSILVKGGQRHFPLLPWLPWILYMVAYIVLDFSFVGLQLTLQYVLPILIGIVASQFDYTWTKLLYLFQWMLKTIAVIYALFVVYTVLFGFSPHMAATPMLFSFLAVFGLAFFFLTGEKRFFMLYLLLFLMPFVSVTRMGLLVFGMIFVLHFANKGVGSKVIASFVGGALMLLVVTSEGFQEKTFYSGEGDITEISLDYYENENFNSSGRRSWKLALEPGLQKAPVWGNGPRADASILGAVMGKEVGEAHNDYMSVRYNYGWVGLTLLLLGFGATFFKLWRIKNGMEDPLFQAMVLSALTLFIPFLLFMYSDNILKYTIWFPNYFFATIGIVFSMYKKGYSYA